MQHVTLFEDADNFTIPLTPYPSVVAPAASSSTVLAEAVFASLASDADIRAASQAVLQLHTGAHAWGQPHGDHFFCTKLCIMINAALKPC